jgi:hypothetical protein
MHARIGSAALLLAIACGPHVESTSETLTDTDSGSGSGSDADSGAGSGSNCPELGPAYDALIDALDRTDLALTGIEAETADVQLQLAELLDLPSDAQSFEIVSALENLYAGNLSGKPLLYAMTTQCAGSIEEGRENLAICLPESDVDAVLFECQGPCTVADPVECPSGTAWCRNGTSSGSCSGNCTGACEIEIGAACDGICRGECDGECGCEDDSGECMGRCEGQCIGICEVVEANCGGDCVDICESVVDTCEDMEWLCLDEGGYCSLDCESWAMPAPDDLDCVVSAALAGAASMTCAPPFASLIYDSTVCADFDATAIELEGLAARLVRNRDHALAVGTAFELVVSRLLLWIDAATTGEVDPCVVETLTGVIQRLMETGDRIVAAGEDIDTLLGAIADQSA